MDRDLVVIGGGPGGYVAAIRAAQLGAKVCLIEKDRLGGTCLNKGCIPTKALYRNAELINTLKHIDDFGINVEGYSLDIEKMHCRKQGIIDGLVAGIEQLLKANHVEVILGTASFKDKNSLHIIKNSGDTLDISASKIIIATGSRPAVPPIPGAELQGIFTSESILNFENIPSTLAIIGGGVIGMEFACIFNALGTKVTVLEFLPTILSQTDSDITKRLLVSLKKKGIEVNTSTKVTAIEKEEQGFKLCLENKKGLSELKAEAVLISTGRAPVTEGLNLEAAGIEYDKSGIKADENFETNIKGIYAIGDINGKVMLAHAASHQGIHAAESAMGFSKRKSLSTAVPNCIFIFPEIASVGITEDKAKELGISYKTSKFMFGANGKALTLGEAEGMVKVISSDDKIIGVNIMGPHASDLIHEGALAIANNLSIDYIENTIHAHPTLSESFAEAVMGLRGEAIHIAPPKK